MWSVLERVLIIDSASYDVCFKCSKLYMQQLIALAQQVITTRKTTSSQLLSSHGGYDDFIITCNNVNFKR